MVELKKDRLVIVIETNYPEETLFELQQSLIQAVSNMDDDLLNRDAIYPVMDFMTKILPSVEQLKKIGQ